MKISTGPEHDDLLSSRAAERTSETSGLIVRRWRAFLTQRAQRATISALHTLDDRTLKDIGLYRCEIESMVCARRDERLHR